MNRLVCALVLAASGLLASGSMLQARAAPSQNQGALQLSILTPDPNSIVDRLSLDVSFRGGTIERVELYLDNNLVAQRQLSTTNSRGVITFSMDVMQLTEGQHDVKVKAYGLDGKAVIANGKVKVPAFDYNAPVRIAYPQNGVLVSGVVPVRVTLDSELQKQKPYVTFFVDKELKVLRNFPPYEYNWDTTKIQNGWHVVEAWSQASDALSPYKARPVHVNVNNAGGETKKLNEIADLRNEKSAKAPSNPLVLKPVASGKSTGKSVDPSSAVTGSYSPVPGVVGKSEKRFESAASTRSALGPFRSNEPSLYGNAKTATRVVTAPGVSAGRSSKLSGPAARMMGNAAQEPRLSPVVSYGPKPGLPSLSSGGTLFPVVAPSLDVVPSPAKAQPIDPLDNIARRSSAAPKSIARHNALLRGKKFQKIGSIVVPKVGSFDVAFDGDRIAFDVQPRVEQGVKLAPFRQIFEHTGGRLYWFGGSAQTVRAVNDSREIEIKIGQKKAMVNNQSVGMERKPFIESGRTIVPLSFIRDSMSVKISYDEKSGRLLIESVK